MEVEIRNESKIMRSCKIINGMAINGCSAFACVLFVAFPQGAISQGYHLPRKLIYPKAFHL
jgi:hypothetical protein